MRDFSLYKRLDPQDGHATHDFRSMKEHVLDYSVGFSGSDALLQVVPHGDAACRMSYEPSRDPLVHVSDADVAFEGPWERVPLAGYNGAVWVTRQAGASATLAFEGSGVRIFGLRQAGAALMRVLVDGTPRAMVDPSGGSVGAQSSVEMLYEVRDLPEGPHKVKVTAADSHGGTLGINVCEVLHHGPRPPQARLVSSTSSGTIRSLTGATSRGRPSVLRRDSPGRFIFASFPTFHGRDRFLRAAARRPFSFGPKSAIPMGKTG